MARWRCSDAGDPPRLRSAVQHRRQVSTTDYAGHVDQMIQQVLFTAPGERVDLPQFGCGLRQLVFSPLSSALAVNTEINVRQALGRWLAGVIDVADVTALTSDDPGGPLV